ncbi:hypothetical protein HY994_00135 [Candidatus Micrarchaeota archaeon]|nr:hypothetical protein [Candidatus Micrarchaeota archaeon]
MIPRSRSRGSDSEQLVHVLKDPVRRQNLLVVRKTDAPGPFGYFNAYSVFNSGEEELVGYSKLSSHSRQSSALLSSVGVVQHTFRKPSTLASEVVRRKSVSDVAGVKAIMRSVDPFAAYPPEPGLRSVSYRGVGLGHLLIRLAEDVAAQAGFRTLYTNAFKGTAGFIVKHGWKVLNEKEHSFWCVKHLRPPQGMREHVDAWLGRVKKAE